MSFDSEKCVQMWKLNKLFDLIYTFDSDIAEKVHHKMKSAEDYPNLLVRLSGKSIVTFREIVTLSANGYPDGALSLARNLYEQFITIAFLNAHLNSIDFNDYIEDYYLDYDLQRTKALVFEAEYCTKDDRALEKLRNQKLNIRSQMHHSNKRGEFWWTGKNSFYDVATEVISGSKDESFRKFLSQLHLLYKRSSLSVHATCMGNYLRLGVSPKFVGVDTSPQANGHALPLYLATNSFIGIVGIVCKEFNIESEALLENLNELAIFYRKSMTETQSRE